MDFTFTTLKDILKALKSQGFLFCGLSDYISNKNTQPPLIILRHDVETRYANALHFAQIQHEMGIRGSYHFRLLPKSFDVTIIKQIAALGHEIGYHYDDLSHCKGNYENAIRRFQQNLAYLREIANVSTISMEGAPLSKYDNRDLWKKYDYKKFDIIGEPYFDLDFNKTFYMTDTGRCWNGAKVSMRDKAIASNPVTNPDYLRRRYRKTCDIIKAIENGDFPDQVMMTFHPQRWTDNKVLWFKEFIIQNMKNQVKRFLVR